MKVAVPSDDGFTVAFHFGRTRGFLHYEVGQGVVTPAGYTPVAGGDALAQSPDHGGRHALVLEALSACDVVIARGIGAHMHHDLVSRRIQIALTDIDDPSAAVALWAAGLLPDAEEGCVKSGHHCSD